MGIDHDMLEEVYQALCAKGTQVCIQMEKLGVGGASDLAWVYKEDAEKLAMCLAKVPRAKMRACLGLPNPA